MDLETAKKEYEIEVEKASLINIIKGTPEIMIDYISEMKKKIKQLSEIKIMLNDRFKDIDLFTAGIIDNLTEDERLFLRIQSKIPYISSDPLEGLFLKSLESIANSFEKGLIKIEIDDLKLKKLYDLLKEEDSLFDKENDPGIVETKNIILEKAPIPNMGDDFFLRFRKYHSGGIRFISDDENERLMEREKLYASRNKEEKDE